jgi:hypothetical protein
MEPRLKSPREVGDIFREHSQSFRDHYKLSSRQMKVFYAVKNCRTAFLGGHIDKCDDCGHIHISYNSCRDRHCPKCQGLKKARWIDKLAGDMLPVSYFHVVFTIPSQLNPVVLAHPRCLYNILFKAASETIITLCKDPKYLGSLTGMVVVLHTWGQNLMTHPHLHCIVPSGGWNDNQGKWTSSSKKFFIPVKVMSRMFKGKFMALLRKEYTGGNLKFTGELSHLASGSGFKLLISDLYDKDWVVYCKKPFENTGQIIEYLGRYSHRVALTNHRIQQADANQVTFRVKDYKDRSKIKSLSLNPEEFIRRFLLHVLPEGFCKIRYYGLFACRNRSTVLLNCKKTIGFARYKSRLTGLNWSEMLVVLTGKNFSVCPVCHKGKMVFDCELATFRGPP